MTTSEPEPSLAAAEAKRTPTGESAPKRAPLQIPASPTRARDRAPLALSRTARAKTNPSPPSEAPDEVELPAAPESGSEARRPRQRPTASGPAAPKYARLVRRDVLITSEQSAGLAALTSEVMSDPRRQQVASAERERITDATLIRVGIDLLLSRHAGQLGGVTEDELRSSVGLPPLQF